MAVVYTGTATVKPDRYEDYLNLIRKTKTLIERAGGKNLRLLVALVAGEATGTFVVTYEADDFAAFGTLNEKFFADPEAEAVMSSLSTSASPIPGYQGTLWLDVPL
jgi:hypothetical protein